jgi:ribosomal protein S18 acetylase RimI-like enzyme
MNYTLRPAVDDDYAFLYELKVACLKEYVVATYGWDETYQQQRFSDVFDAASTRIIVVEDKDVGQLTVEEVGDELFLAGIYVSPDWQNRGIGSAVIADVLNAAKTRGLRVQLQVLQVNPARHLYERLGFSIVAETKTHCKMRW